MKNAYQPTKEELVVINERFAKEPYKSPDQLYLFSAMIIDNQLTSYFTKVHPTFLEQIVKDLFNGVGFLVGHDRDKIPMARSFKGHLTSDGNVMEVFAKFFMQKDLEVNGLNTDDFMRAFLGGITEDVSIGFSAKRYECSICHNDVRSLKCAHWPGKKYDDKDKESEKGVLCFAWVMEPGGPNGEALVEVSAVFKGAAPAAKQKKASDVPKFMINLAEGKKLKEMPLEEALAMNLSFSLGFEKAKANENTFDINKFFAGEYSKEELNKIELSAENKEALVTQYKKTLEEGKDKLQIVETNKQVLFEQIDVLKIEIKDYKQAIEKNKQDVEILKKSNAQFQIQVRDLQILADIGKVYREDTIKEILGMGIRLQGNNYDIETNKKMLEEPTTKLADIKKIKDQFLQELEERFPRKQTEGEPLQLPIKEGEEVPDAAFKI